MILLLIFMFTGCGQTNAEALQAQKEEMYTNSDGSLHNSNVNSFEGRKTLPRKCGDLPF